MLHWRNQQTSTGAVRQSSVCSPLLLHIHAQRLRDARYKCLTSILKICRDLAIFSLVLLIFQCPNRVYNAWKGPFPISLHQFRAHLNINYNSIGDASIFPYSWSLFQPQYVQIELGKNEIDQSEEDVFRVYYGHYSYGRLLYTFNRIREPTIDTSFRTLFVKFAAHEQSHFQKRHSYHFQSFSIHTLRCIVEQLTIPSTEFMHWLEKSIYIQKIEQIYSQNPMVFNRKVITKCGILLGYLYRPANELVFAGSSYEQYQLSEHVRVFDASCSYTPYISFALIGLFIYLMLPGFVHLVREIFDVILPSLPIVYPAIIQEQMRESNINSPENLDDLLLNTTAENNHYDQLFIVRRKYLIMFMINLNENDEKILRRFNENAPFTIIPIVTIRTVRGDCIVVENNNHSQCIYFPTRSYNSGFNPMNWLHGRLMALNAQYRYAWEQQQLWHDEEIRRTQEEHHRRLLAILTGEEAQYQWQEHGNDINRIWQRITSASPRFIAQFRLNDRQIVTHDLLNISCSICLEDLQLNQHFAQWSCAAKHTFHFDCMLNVLRAGNTCPLCRHPVEAADLPNSETVLRLILARMMPHGFT